MLSGARSRIKRMLLRGAERTSVTGVIAEMGSFKG